MEEVKSEKKVKVIRPQEGFQEQFLASSADIAIGGGSAGSGKMAPYTEPTLTPDGWRPMGDIKVGSRVIDPITGNPIKVTHIHPHKNLKIYKISFNDGTSTECCGDHLWRVQTRKQVIRGNYQVIDVNKMIEVGIKDSRGDNKFSIDCNAPVNFKEKGISLDPYLLGLLLGDGYLPTASCAMVSMQVHIDEAESLFDYIQNLVPLNVKTRLDKQYESNCRRITFTHKIKQPLKDLGLLGVKSRGKFVPKHYLYNTVEVRKKVLAGLLDTDGYINVIGSKKKVSFSTMSAQLKDDVCELVRSLGGVASVSDCDKREKYNGGICYKVAIRLPFNPFERDRRKVLFDSVGYKFHFKKKITGIDYIGRKDGQCITVDSPDHLYITNGYNATHNSFVLLMEALYDIEKPSFRAMFFRRKLVQLDGLIDESQNLYPKVIPTPEFTENKLKWTFPSGATVHFNHIQYEKDKENHQGKQYALIGFDELTHFSLGQFMYLISRNRSVSGAQPRVRATCNPEAGSWVAELIDWWIGDDGFPIPERSGKLRYFLSTSGKISDFIWGDSFEEVKEKGSEFLSALMKKANGNVKESDFIKSLTFIPGSIYENKELLKVNPGYLGSLASQSEADRAALLDGNWKFEIRGEELVSSDVMDEFFNRYPQVNGRRCISADVAGKGSDNMVVLVWDGFHLMDLVVISRSNGKEIVDAITGMMRRYHIDQRNVVFDANGVGSHIDGYIPNAVEFKSQAQPLNKEYYADLKTQCSIRWADRMNRKLIDNPSNLSYSIDRKLLDRVYGNKDLSEHFLQERKAIRMDPSSVDGKPKIIKKSEMISIIGHSPDFIEAMLMLELLYLENKTFTGKLIW